MTPLNKIELSDDAGYNTALNIVLNNFSESIKSLHDEQKILRMDQQKQSETFYSEQRKQTEILTVMSKSMSLLEQEFKNRVGICSSTFSEFNSRFARDYKRLEDIEAVCEKYTIEENYSDKKRGILKDKITIFVSILTVVVLINTIATVTFVKNIFRSSQSQSNINIEQEKK